MQIKFGTDGWRARTDEDFTIENVRKVIQAFADFLPKKEKSKKVYVGYDRRNLSPEAATASAEVLAANGYEVYLSSDFCPAPCISWQVKSTGSAAGVMITASHNPAVWNGVKFKESYGGSASPEFCQEVEKIIVQNEKAGKRPKEGKAKITKFDPRGDYVRQLRKMVNVGRIKKAGWDILFDPLFGAGAGYLANVLEEDVSEIHSKRDLSFGGLNPEPNAKNLPELLKIMKEGKYDVGFATDGDADRIGAVDENGNFVDSHHCYALILKYLLEVKKWPGEIVTTVSTTDMVKKLADIHHRKYYDLPVGFKYICKKFLEIDPLIGGEESGGIAVCKHVYERDGALSALMLLEMMTHYKKRLGELIKELHNEVGPHYFTRNDLHISEDEIEKIRSYIKNGDKAVKIGALKVARIDQTDGLKYYLEDGSWFMVRASGTEPLVRLYVEASSPQNVETVMSAGKLLLPLC